MSPNTRVLIVKNFENFVFEENFLKKIFWRKFCLIHFWEGRNDWNQILGGGIRADQNDEKVSRTLKTFFPEKKLQTRKFLHSNSDIFFPPKRAGSENFFLSFKWKYDVCVCNGYKNFEEFNSRLRALIN